MKLYSSFGKLYNKVTLYSYQIYQHSLSDIFILYKSIWIYAYILNHIISIIKLSVPWSIILYFCITKSSPVTALSNERPIDTPLQPTGIDKLSQ